MKKTHVVRLERFAEKQTQKLPKVIQEALLIWIESVELQGLPEVRKLPGYHDENLKGTRRGQRSVRLTRAYRVIYEEHDTGELVIVAIQEVNKHEY